MKKLLPTFIIKIKEVLGQYHKQINDVGLNFDKVMSTKYGQNTLKQK